MKRTAQVVHFEIDHGYALCGFGFGPRTQTRRAADVTCAFCVGLLAARPDRGEAQGRQAMKRKRIEWVVCKAMQGTPWPGEWWESFSSEAKARREFRQHYDDGMGTFRLCRAIITEAPKRKGGKRA